MASGDENRNLFVVLYSYNPNENSPNDDVSDELTLNEGDYIEVFGDMDQDGFYNAAHLEGPDAGRMALAPSNFLTALTEQEATSYLAEVALKSDAGGEPVGEAALVTVLYDYNPNDASPNEDVSDELTMREGQVPPMHAIEFLSYR